MNVKFQTYEVTLRRDVQQVAVVRVDASSRQSAIGVAEAAVDDAAWKIEEHVAAHAPRVTTVRPPQTGAYCPRHAPTRRAAHSVVRKKARR